jgi:hypothetical protein
MRQKYIELDDVCHLYNKNLGCGSSDKLWRESYYFNVSDKRSGLGLITTIGILPNRKLITGFVIIIKNSKVFLIKPLVEMKKPIFHDYSFIVKGLEYTIEGINWRLKYISKDFCFNIQFSPINKIYPYIIDKSDKVFSRIGSQHFEQFGIYQGEFALKEERITIGPCLGFRDHSWGIRDWSSVDYYKLYNCAFSRNFAFNLWLGSINGNRFLKGYVFDGEKNIELLDCKVQSIFFKNGKDPKGAKIWLMDKRKRCFRVSCDTITSIPVPPRKSILYETIAKMKIKGNTGYGLQEYLYHEKNPMKRFCIFLKTLSMARVV